MLRSFIVFVVTEFLEADCLPNEKGQAQPLAAALATATTVVSHLMLMLLTGAVAVRAPPG